VTEQMHDELVKAKGTTKKNIYEIVDEALKKYFDKVAKNVNK
jgi:hypothetical protein